MNLEDYRLNAYSAGAGQNKKLVHKPVFENVNSAIDRIEKQTKEHAERQNIEQAKIAAKTGTWFEKKKSATSEDVKDAAKNLTSGGLVKIPASSTEKDNIYRRVAKFLVIIGIDEAAKILPHLNEIKDRAIIVCVDTALHSCLEFNVEPDFIILADPQYYCSLHLEFLKSPESILVTEIAVYPSVFRFQCKEIVLFSSMFPIGKFFEKNTQEKGLLAAGGSVTTTAWDFAKMCGASEIYLAGMDLGFPNKETHIRGSKFEEKIHCESFRTKTSETKNIETLFSAAPFYAKDYNGNEILTDKKMQLFSWWFEKNCTNAAAQGIKTFSLTLESLAINGIEKFSLEEFLLKPAIKDKRKIFFEKAQENKKKLSKPKEISFEQQKNQFGENLKLLESLAKKGINLCSKALCSPLSIPEVFAKLNEIDQKISSSSAKDAAALVFPTQRQLDSLSEKIPNNSEAEKKLYSIRYSNLIYTELLKSINLYKKFFPNSN